MNMRAGIIGTGNMGAALAKGIAQKIGAEHLFLLDVDVSKAKNLAQKLQAQAETSLKALAKSVDYLFLGIKPQALTGLCQELAPILQDSGSRPPVLVSIIAGTSAAHIATLISSYGGPNDIEILRIMPNTPALIGKGLIALASSPTTNSAHIQQLQEMLSLCGLVEIVDEGLMEAVTAVSGSGPAYVYVFIEALADAAVRTGFSREQALRFAAQTLYGSSSMVLETGEHPASLKDAVCSPAGTSIEALAVLEKNGLRAAVHAAVQAAYQKAIELGKKALPRTAENDEASGK